MHTRLALVVLLAGCEPELPPAPAAASVWVEEAAVASGAGVRVHTPAGAEAPVAEGLSFEQVATDELGAPTWLGTGEDGSYIIAAGGTTLYVDIGVKGPGGKMADLQAPPPAPEPWWPILLAGAVGGAVIAALTLAAWRRYRPVPPSAPTEPSDRVARREWAAVRARAELSPEEMAVALSTVYRRYLDATHSWQATSRTTREILDNLADELLAADLERAARLLRAMDLIKFAGREAHAELFITFDQDFDALVRPRVLGA